ncbi:aldehyde reductase [Aquabacter sp. CN5-332]|uniref:SDR family oxidoreductase n=1 Tax=Aquabacter sp. CN5-332 TaxID=3156608 RepID=UPI0032B61A3F
MSRVLVTGGSGFIGSHAILQLLAAGHEVCATLRNLAREGEVRAMLKEGGVEAGGHVSFIAADLQRDAGWAEAAAGCEYVLHVASPLPQGQPKHEDELIIPARDGTLRVLRAARDAGVRRVVVTSSFAAIGYGRGVQEAPFDETGWTDPTRPDVQAYMRSKTLAERAAWDFIAREGGGLELSVINPTGVFGPTLGPDLSGSLALIKGLMDGIMPGVPRICFGVVDVRDVVDLHIRAMTHPAAKGERFIAVSGDFMWLREIAGVLQARMGSAGKRAPRFTLPDWMVRLAAVRSPMAKASVPLLSVVRNATSEKAMRVLGWSPRSADDAIVASGESLVKFGLLRG